MSIALRMGPTSQMRTIAKVRVTALLGKDSTQQQGDLAKE